jgi:class 3 adenylate cyclase
MISRINNLSIRNKLRLFTLGTCLILTVIFLVAIWKSTTDAVRQDLRSELNVAVQQFNDAERSRLRENLESGKNIANAPPARSILSGDPADLCRWGKTLLRNNGLQLKGRALEDKPAEIDLIAAVDSNAKTIDIITHARPCESGAAESPFPVPADPATAELTDWEALNDKLYELVQAPVTDASGKDLGRMVVGFEVDDQLARYIVTHATWQAETDHEQQPVQVVLWHMDAPGRPHILGQSDAGIPTATLIAALNQSDQMDGWDSAELEDGGYSFVTEPFAKHSSVFRETQDLRITVVQDIAPKLVAFHKLERFLALMAALAMLLGFFFGAFFSRPIAEPLVGLASAAESVAEGHLDRAHTLMSNNNRSGATDEIGVLERSFVRMVRGLKERLAMSTFLSQATYKHICADALDGAGENAAVRTSLAVLFSDIRQFTDFSETESPEAVIALLNQVLSIQAGIVERHGGDINKFIGDAVFAWFAGDNRCQRALAAATEIVAALKTLFAGKPGTQVGIGIHVGELVVGSVGSHDRKDYTAIGSVVNKAARLCARAHAGQILVSAEAAAELNDNAALNALDPVHLKGIAEPVQVFEAIPPTSS